MARALTLAGAARAASFLIASIHCTVVSVNVGTVHRVRNSVEFTEKDIQKDPAAIEELIAMNSQSTPTTIIDGEVIIGFARQEIAEKLGL